MRPVLIRARALLNPRRPGRPPHTHLPQFVSIPKNMKSFLYALLWNFILLVPKPSLSEEKKIQGILY